ncbi:MAG: hypothetical protein WBV72_02155 [Nitrososphaeraceae archaeon]
MVSTLTLIRQEEEIQLQDRMEMENPLALFMYALRAPETRRQWPRRLKTFAFLAAVSIALMTAFNLGGKSMIQGQFGVNLTLL